MKAIKQLGFKLIVVLCVISTFCCFVASAPVNAASKVKSDEFYYSGTTKGSYTVDKGFLDKIVSSLGEILDYLLGIMGMGFRMVLVGWAELMERLLTWILEGASGVEINVEGVEPTGHLNNDDYITIESIVFNHVLLFNINVFNFEVDETHNSLGQELKDGEVSDISSDSLINVLKETIAGWYYSFRLIAIMIMLILLIYIGIKLAIASSTKEKALYKQVLFDWLVGMVLVFSIHYIILAMIHFNEILVAEIEKMDLGYHFQEAYEYGLKERADGSVTNSEMEIAIYDEVRTRAYDAKLSVGTTGMIMYMILIYYAWKYSFIYLKRYLIVAVLIMMAPLVSVMYAYNRVRTGKAAVFTNWIKELFFMIILQSIHALLYVVFMQAALSISLSSIGGMLLSFIMLHFMGQAEEVFRKIFNVQGNLTSDVAGSKLKDIGKTVSSIGLGVVGTKAAVATTKFAARIATKPFRTAGNYGFGKIMESRANKTAARNKQIEENKKRYGNLSKNVLDILKEQRSNY